MPGVSSQPTPMRFCATLVKSRFDIEPPENISGGMRRKNPLFTGSGFSRCEVKPTAPGATAGDPLVARALTANWSDIIR